MPYVLAISAGIVMYNFFKAWVYNWQSQKLRKAIKAMFNITYYYDGKNLV